MFLMALFAKSFILAALDGQTESAHQKPVGHVKRYIDCIYAIGSNNESRADTTGDTMKKDNVGKHLKGQGVGERDGICKGSNPLISPKPSNMANKDYEPYNYYEVIKTIKNYGHLHKLLANFRKLMRKKLGTVGISGDQYKNTLTPKSLRTLSKLFKMVIPLRTRDELVKLTDRNVSFEDFKKLQDYVYFPLQYAKNVNEALLEVYLIECRDSAIQEAMIKPYACEENMIGKIDDHNSMRKRMSMQKAENQNNCQERIEKVNEK